MKKKVKLQKNGKDIRLHLIRKINHVKYRIYNPGGNKTALVINKKYSNKEIKYINNFILKKYKELEQVGFIERDKYELNMAGGEFCVNATRCAIWNYLKGKKGNIRIKVSGKNELIRGGIDIDNKVFANLKINKNINELIKEKDKYKVVNLDGISLIVLNEKESIEYLDKEDKMKEKSKKILSKLKLNSKAEGVILQIENNIYPIIWVKSIDTVYLETACGSGSLATAIVKNMEENKKEFKILQPSGSYLKIELNIKKNVLISAKVSGKMGG